MAKEVHKAKPHKIQPYIQTGYYSIDLVGACINHAEMFGRHVKEIRLDHKIWAKFADSIRHIDEEMDVSNYSIEWDDNHGGTVTVMRGHHFMPKKLTYILHPIIDDRKKQLLN